MRINPRESNFTDSSPCKGCEIHEKGIDKLRCFARCDALAAYRDNASWKNSARLTMAELNGQKKKPEKVEEPKEKICLGENCNEPTFCRGLCYHHYNNWHYGTFLHPTLGEFKYKNGTLMKKKDPDKGSRKARLESNTVILNFSLYPGLKKAIMQRSQERLLPIKATIMNLLSDAVTEGGD